MWNIKKALGFGSKEKEFVLNYHLLNDSIVLNYEGKTRVVANGDERYPQVFDAIKHGQLQLIPGIVEIERKFNDGPIQLKDGLLEIEGEQLPSELYDRVLKFKAQGLPYDSLLKFWKNLKKNPSFNSRKMLYAFLSHNGIPLTQDGCFIAYRGLNDDFTDRHTGKWDNSPGKVCEMDRAEVDENPNNTCSHGLHVACHAYAKDFGSKLVEVKVNPADVVAVPTDYNGTKMRVCKFVVVQECENIREELVYPEAKETEEEAEHYEDELKGEEEESDEDNCSACGAERDTWADYCSACGHEFIN